MGTSANNSVYIDFHLFFDIELMSYRVNDFSPPEPFFHDSYSSSSLESTEIIDSLTPLLNYHTKSISHPFSSRIVHPTLSFLEHYDSVSFASLLCACSHKEEQFSYPLN